MCLSLRASYVLISPLVNSPPHDLFALRPGGRRGGQLTAAFGGLRMPKGLRVLFPRPPARRLPPSAAAALRQGRWSHKFVPGCRESRLTYSRRGSRPQPVFTLRSRNGVQQGDVLGPTLFALGYAVACVPSGRHTQMWTSRPNWTTHT